MSKVYTLSKEGVCFASLGAALDFFKPGFKRVHSSDMGYSQYVLYDPGNDHLPAHMILASRVNERQDPNLVFAVASFDNALCYELVRDFVRITRIPLRNINSSGLLTPSSVNYFVSGHFRMFRSNPQVALRELNLRH